LELEKIALVEVMKNDTDQESDSHVVHAKCGGRE
jgi:hypothetical protein